MAKQVSSLHELLDRVEQAASEHERVSLGAILKEVGRRSFGPLILVAGLIAVAPVIGDIPGVPTIVGIFVLLIAGQLVFHRDHFWLPRWMLRRSVPRDRLCKALGWVRRPARFVDRHLRPRLTLFTHATAMYVMAIVCMVIAAAMPAMEIIPMAANVAGAALTAFGLAMIVHDGLLALVGFAFTAATLGVVLWGVL